MFQHVAEHDAIKLGHVRRSRANRSDIGLKATLAARSRTARRRIEPGDGGESLFVERSEQSARGAAGIENRGGS